MRPGIGGEHEDAVAHQHRLLDIMRDHQDRFGRHPPFRPEIEQVGAQRFGGQHVERGEGLVHQQNLGLHDQRAGKADALAHAAGKLLRIGRFKAVEADHVDRGDRALARFGGRGAMGAQADLDIVEHAQPREQREALKHHRGAVVGAGDGLAVEGHLAAGRPRQARDDAQQGRLAAARAPEQADDLAFPQGQRNVLQDRRAGFAGAFQEALADMADIEQNRGSDVEHRISPTMRTGDCGY